MREAKLSKECSHELRTFKLDVTEDSDVQKALEVVKSDLPSQGTVKRSRQNADHAEYADRADRVLFFLFSFAFVLTFDSHMFWFWSIFSSVQLYIGVFVYAQAALARHVTVNVLSTLQGKLHLVLNMPR